MINDAPLARFASLAGGLLKPIYSDYSFANIANTIEHLLTGDLRGSLLRSTASAASIRAPARS